MKNKKTFIKITTNLILLLSLCIVESWLTSCILLSGTVGTHFAMWYIVLFYVIPPCIIMCFHLMTVAVMLFGNNQ